MEGHSVWGVKKFIRRLSSSSRPKGQKRTIHELDSVVEVEPTKSSEAGPNEPETSTAPSAPPLPYLHTNSPQLNKSDLQNALSNNQDHQAEPTPKNTEEEDKRLQILQERIERIREEKERLERLQHLKDLEEQTKQEIMEAHRRANDR
jgi:hypothetical protein